MEKYTGGAEIGGGGSDGPVGYKGGVVDGSSCGVYSACRYAAGSGREASGESQGSVGSPNGLIVNLTSLRDVLGCQNLAQKRPYFYTFFTVADLFGGDCDNS
jgi:hypothetical protein